VLTGWIQTLGRGRLVAFSPGNAPGVAQVVGPAGWKELSLGQSVEARTMELGADGVWIYAIYVWNEEGTDAVLAPESGVRGAAQSAFGTRVDVPSVADCRACHDAGPSALPGFSALQLSSDRDPLASHCEVPAKAAVDLDDLVARGLVRGLHAELVATPPRIEAATARERAALGYLHGNCGGSHISHGARPPRETSPCASAAGDPSRHHEPSKRIYMVTTAAAFRRDLLGVTSRGSDRPDQPGLRVLKVESR
jgi:hypothetical protein